MATWEHLITPQPVTGIDGLTADLDARGQEGWELVTFVPQETGVLSVFKRRSDTQLNDPGQAIYEER